MQQESNPEYPPTAVITGATKGIGRAIAEQFATKGFDLFVCARSAVDLDAMQTAWVKNFPGRQLYTQAADLGEKAAVLQFADAVRQQWARLDTLVNNAGLFLPGSMLDEPDGALEQMINVNLYGAYHLTRALLPAMRPYRKGHIFNVCSVASLKAKPGSGSYSVSKFALLGFSRNLREELKNEGIKVTALLPGSTWTASWEGSELPMERLVQAEDIAQAVWAAYQLSDSAVVEELIIRPRLGDI